MERKLSAHEAMLYAAGSRLVLKAELDGALDPECLARAVHRLGAIHPVLIGTISPSTDGGYTLRAGSSSERPPHQIFRNTTYEHEMNAELDWSKGPLYRVALLTDEPGPAIAVSAPRALLDGMAFFALFHSLWELYTDIVQGRDYTVAPAEPVISPPLEETLLRRYPDSALQGFLARRAQLASRTEVSLWPDQRPEPQTVPVDRPHRARRIELGHARTDALDELSRKTGISGSNLLSGALLAAVRDALGTPQEPRTLVCLSAVDLRRRMTPRIADDIPLSAASASHSVMEITGTEPPVPVAERVAASMSANLAERIPELEVAALPKLLTANCPLPPSLVISSLGRIPTPLTPPGLTVSRLHFNVAVTHQSLTAAFLHTFRGCVNIDLPYNQRFYAAAQMDAFHSAAERRLVELLGSA